MNYNTIIEYATKALIASGLISLVVSLLVQFLVKPLTKNLTTILLNEIILGLSEVITVIIGMVLIELKLVTSTWYYWVGVIFMGFLVAIISMNGYDKIFSYVYQWINDVFNKDNK